MICWASPTPMLSCQGSIPMPGGDRLTALVNTTLLARRAPTVYVLEDAHWIDEVSDSMLTEFFTVIPQTPSLVLITYRTEYRGFVEPDGRCAGHRPCAVERFGHCSTGFQSSSAATPHRWCTGEPRRSPRRPLEIHSPPRKWCGT